MCFSAAGSFALSGVLAGVGTVAVARNTSKPHRPLAAIPLLFAAQQAAEGIVWSTFPPSDHDVAHAVATVAFLVVAMVIWPVWVPWSLRQTERRPGRRRVLSSLLALGVLVAMGSTLMMMRSPPVAAVAGHSIRYELMAVGNSAVAILLLVSYLVPTIAPFLVSTMRTARAIGVTLMASLIATLLVERDALTSVWCFFAAVLSIQVLVAIEHVRRAAPSRDPSS